MRPIVLPTSYKKREFRLHICLLFCRLSPAQSLVCLSRVFPLNARFDVGFNDHVFTPPPMNSLAGKPVTISSMAVAQGDEQKNLVRCGRHQHLQVGGNRRFCFVFRRLDRTKLSRQPFCVDRSDMRSICRWFSVNKCLAFLGRSVVCLGLHRCSLR